LQKQQIKHPPNMPQLHETKKFQVMLKRRESFLHQLPDHEVVPDQTRSRQKSERGTKREPEIFRNNVYESKFLNKV
jgi:hypothetical protein